MKTPENQVGGDPCGSPVSKTSRFSKLDALRARGCTCGLDDDAGRPVGGCALHSGQSDNRGLRAWFEAGMPQGFPMSITCGVCGSPDALMYPDVDQENPDKPFVHTPTGICPNCSTAYLEARLRAKCEANGYGNGRLNDRRVFGIGKLAA